MEFDTERILQISPDLLESAGLIQKSPHGSKRPNQGYCCVYCTSGTGGNQSGALDFKQESNGHWVHHCLVCGNKGNNIAFFKHVFNPDFKEAMIQASEMFGIPYLDSDWQPNHSGRRHNAPPNKPFDNTPYKTVLPKITRYKMPTEKTDPKELPLIQRDIELARKHLSLLPVDQLRGLEFDTLKFFGVGYLDNWAHPKSILAGKVYPSRRIIIPTPDNEHYHALALDIDRKRNRNNNYFRPKMHAGVKTKCFNADDLSYKTVIVTEGEIDAMSIFQALYFEGYKGHPFSFKDGRVGVVATLSAAGWQQLIMPLIDNGYDVSRQFIILYDNDDSGRKNAEQFQKALQERGRKAVVKFLGDYLKGDLQPDHPLFNKKLHEKFPDKVDANDILRVNHMSLRIILLSILQDAEKEFDAKKSVMRLDIDIPHTVISDKEAAQCMSGSPQMIVPKDTTPIAYSNKVNQQTIDYTNHPEQSESTPKDLTPPTDNQSPPQSALDVWQQFNGRIDPEVIPRLSTARQYLEQMIAEPLTPDAVHSSLTVTALAYCKFYDAFYQLYSKFLAKLENTKHSAESQIKQSKTAGSDFVAVDESLFEWKAVSIRDLKANVNKIVRDIEKAHKKFKRDDLIRRQNEQHIRDINARDELKKSKVQKLFELHNQPRTPERDQEIVELLLDTLDWKLGKHGEKLEVKTTAANLHLIFSFDPNIADLISYDKFQQTYTVKRNAPWHDEDSAGEEWRDSDDAQLRLYVRTTYPEFGNDKILFDAVVKYGRMNSYHEVKDFIDALPTWDGTPRAADIFIKFLGAKDNDYTKTITMNWLMGAFARLYYPGCDYQICLVLPGEQRTGKSRILSMLGGALGVNPKGKNWHISLGDNVEDSHAIDAIKQGWIIELEENYATKKADVAAIKRFISAAADTRRFAYGRRAETFKRHNVLAITVNSKSFLRDPTGNARFYVVECHNKKFQQVDGMTPEYIRQVLAEVYHKFKIKFAGVTARDTARISELLRLPIEFQIANEQQNEKFMQDDGMLNELLSWTQIKLPIPEIWNLLTRNERSLYCANGGQLTLQHGREDIKQRRKTRSPYNLEKDLETIDNYFNNHKLVKEFGTDGATIYGNQLRTHICPAEILNEAFAPNDRRKSPSRINELFAELINHGWQEGSAFTRDSAYAKQRKVLWRTSDNSTDVEPPHAPTPDDTSSTQTTDTPPASSANGLPTPESSATTNQSLSAAKDYDFGGEPIDPDDLPF